MQLLLHHCISINRFGKKVVKSVETANINLDIGYGTFQPLNDDPIDQTTKLHQESYHVPLETVKKIHNCKKNNGRVIALGTTTLRALESAVSEDGDIIVDPMIPIFLSLMAILLK